MSGEGYTGHVNGDSAPYQFKIPAATSSQIGVMTPAQVDKLDSIPGGGSALQLTFGAIFSVSFSLPLDGSLVFVGGSAVLRGSLPNNILDSKRINAAQSLSKFAVTIPTLFVDATVVTANLYKSSDNGQTYQQVATVSLHSGAQSAEASFGPTTFPAGTLFCIGAQTDGAFFSCGLTATVS